MPSEVVSVDFMGDLQKSVKGNIHIFLTMVENFFKVYESLCNERP